MNKYKKLERIYALLPNIKCKKLCHDFCGPIEMTEIEKKRIIDRTGHYPIKPMAETFSELMTNKCAAQSCHFLINKECSIYDIRPLICRAFGVIKKLKCPHGCVPNSWLSDKEVLRIFKEIDKL